MANIKLENNRIRKEELIEGALVYVGYDRGGWTHFRYPRLIPELITRITPARTKFVTDKQEHDKYTNFYEINEETDKIREVGVAYDKIRTFQYDFGKITVSDFSDEDLLELDRISNEMKSIISKYKK